MSTANTLPLGKDIRVFSLGDKVQGLKGPQGGCLQWPKEPCHAVIPLNLALVSSTESARLGRPEQRRQEALVCLQHWVPSLPALGKNWLLLEKT